MDKPAENRHRSHEGSGSAHPQPERARASMLVSWVVGGLLLVALAVGAYALYRMDSWSGNADSQRQRHELDLSAHVDIPEELLAYKEQRRSDLSLQVPTGIAAGSDGSIYVVGDTGMEILRPDDTKSMIELDDQPMCVAVSQDEDAAARRIYVGATRQVIICNGAGEVVDRWPIENAKSVLTGIAVAREHVFVADAGQRAVLHFGSGGELMGMIGQADPDRQMPGFVIPSPHFDLVAGQEEMLHVVNPGARRIESFSFDGELQSFWGRGGSQLADFFGCCNPAELTCLPDGRFVTSEKGIPRIKVYSPEGEFQQVVAGPRQLGIDASALGDARGNQPERIFDVAVDRHGIIVVLDAKNRQIVWFEPRAADEELKS